MCIDKIDWTFTCVGGAYCLKSSGLLDGMAQKVSVCVIGAKLPCPIGIQCVVSSAFLWLGGGGR